MNHAIDPKDVNAETDARTGRGRRTKVLDATVLIDSLDGVEATREFYETTTREFYETTTREFYETTTREFYETNGGDDERRVMPVPPSAEALVGERDLLDGDVAGTRADPAWAGKHASTKGRP